VQETVASGVKKGAAGRSCSFFEITKKCSIQLMLVLKISFFCLNSHKMWISHLTFCNTTGKNLFLSHLHTESQCGFFFYRSWIS